MPFKGSSPVVERAQQLRARMKSPHKRADGRSERSGSAGGKSGAGEAKVRELSSLTISRALQATSSCVETQVSPWRVSQQQGWGAEGGGEQGVGGEGVEVRRYLPVILPAAAEGELDHVSRPLGSTNSNPQTDPSLDLSMAGSARGSAAGRVMGPAGDDGHDLRGAGVRVWGVRGKGGGAHERASPGHAECQVNEPYERGLLELYQRAY